MSDLVLIVDAVSKVIAGASVLAAVIAGYTSWKGDDKVSSALKWCDRVVSWLALNVKKAGPK